MAQRRHETPLKRVNPSGKIVWVARWTNRQGVRKSAGTYELRGACRQPVAGGECCAQHAIDAAYEREAGGPRRPDTVAAFASTWTDRHPRSDRTNKSYNGRMRQVLDVELEHPAGGKVRFGSWVMGDVRRRQATDLIHELLTKQKRSQMGAVGILRVLSTMWQDALNDEVVETNPFYGVKIKASDPRIEKAPRRISVWSWEQMREFARLAGTVETGKTDDARIDAWRPIYAEAMVRVFSDCGLRLGEVLPLRRADLRLESCSECDRPGRKAGPHLHVERTAHEGLVQHGTKVDHGEAGAGRVVPVPPGLEVLLRGLPARIDTPLLFPSPTGRMWRESTFYRDVWWATWDVSAITPRPHEFRHSFVSHLRAAGVDDADLAAITGHTVATMISSYTHALGQSFDSVRRAIGE